MTKPKHQHADEWYKCKPGQAQQGRPRVITSHVHPPIPTTQFDWCAYREGEEELGNYGWGATERAAIFNLYYEEGIYDDDDDLCIKP
jgi:hypothetical protein